MTPPNAPSLLPQLAVFDLDRTIWRPSIHQFYIRNSKDKMPQAGIDIHLYSDVLPMLDEFRDAGIKIAVASKLGSRNLVMHLLRSFHVLDKIDYIELGPQEKTVHFKSLHARSGVPFHKMILFDDLRDGRYGNCVPVSSKLGVFSIYCPYGIYKKGVRTGLQRYMEWMSNDSWCLGGAVVEEDGSVSSLQHPVEPSQRVLNPSSSFTVKAPTPDEQEFIAIGFRIMGDRKRIVWNKESYRRFRATFGASPTVCQAVWSRLQQHSTQGIYKFKEHLLWALMWLKQYGTETTIANQIGRGLTEKTLRDWVKIYVEAVSKLAQHVIKWEDRKEGDIGSRCLIVVDGTDFAILNQHTGDYTKWKSKKKGINGPAVKYEVATCIQTGKIVWIHGPFKGGTHDKKMFDHALKHKLEPGEKAEADDGYKGLPDHIALPVDPRAGSSAAEISKSLARRRHETANKRFKQWGCLSQTYRHRVQFHQHVFSAVAVITQLIFECGEPLFPVEYNIL